jgi:hypothetical protein
MLDQPNAEEILEVVARMLREQLTGQVPASAAFQARVAANALDLVRRQIADGDRLERESHARLRALLGHDGQADALERELCERIRERRLDASTPGLMEHLMASTLAKMSIDQPSYASYRRALDNKE